MADKSRLVLALDVSGSMKGMKIETLHLAATRYIEDIPPQAYVGVVLFDHESRVVHPIKQITDDAIRDGLKAAIPLSETEDGGTNIGDGLLSALKCLTDAGLPTERSTLILVTDGHDGTAGSYVDRVLDQLIRARVKVVCIAIGNEADKNLERLSKETLGNSYVASDRNREMAVRVIESTIQEVKTSKELTETATIGVCNDIVTVGVESVTWKVVIDPDIGHNTCFTIGSQDIDKFDVTVESPAGRAYRSASAEFIKNVSLKRYQLKLATAEPGLWGVNFRNRSSGHISATLTVSSLASKANPVLLKVWLRDVDITQFLPPIIFAEIRREMSAIIGAEVIATVDKPDGTQSEIKLINFGNIYSNYFTDYCGDGRYNVSVLAKSQEWRATASPNADHQFQRQRIAGCFKVNGFSPAKPFDNSKLEEISLAESMKSMTLPVGQSVSRPAPRTARARITRPTPAPRNSAGHRSDEIGVAKVELRKLYLTVNRLLGFDERLSAEEKAQHKCIIENVDKFIASTASTTLAEVADNRQKLNLIKEKLV